MVPGILIPLTFIIISSYIIWKSTESFAIGADFLGRNMSRGVKGATINAVASSMPEFLTTLFFLFTIRNESSFNDNFAGGLGVTAGSAIFNILIIPAAILVFGTASLRKNGFKINKKLIQRDGVFLLFSNFILIFLIFKKQLDFLDGLILILIYIFYLVLLRKDFGFKKKRENSPAKIEIPSVKLNLLHFLSLDLKQILFNGRKLNKLNSWINLIISTSIMSLGTWLLVEGVELLGMGETYTKFGIKGLIGLDFPLLFLSVLLASAATSIPDTMLSIRDAKKGNYDDSISNALGSNIFDISFALGLPLFIYTLIYPEGIIMSESVRVGGVTVWLLMLSINLIVIPIFIYSKNINRFTGLFLLLLYILFVFYIIEENSRFALVSRFVQNILNFLHANFPIIF
ncbi:MAG: hypothetical protein K9H49_15555 [Bacteroidales bacterium]|nr:hypothetical protein [Bacteroidales bacterium]MCF8405484.1 hypothetical protein [Bacteroidales bacterium]